MFSGGCGYYAYYAYWLLQTPTAAEWYRRKFEPEREPYTQTGDVWMRYHDEQDVTMWGGLPLGLAADCPHALCDRARLRSVGRRRGRFSPWVAQECPDLTSPAALPQQLARPRLLCGW